MENRQETLEEALEKYGKEIGIGNMSYLKCAEFGAKWKSQNMYTEKEVLNLLLSCPYDFSDNIKSWFKQNKKK
jgi:hypothetical protein